MSIPDGFFYKDGAYWAAADNSGPYGWDGINMYLLGTDSLGTFTWTELQAAYPNGGAALAALPITATAVISDWGALFSPNLSKTFWRPIAPILLGGTFTTITQTDAVTTEQLALSIRIPAKLLQPGGLVRGIAIQTIASNANAKQLRVKLDNAQTGVTGTSIGFQNSTTGGSILQEYGFGVKSATAKRYNLLNNTGWWFGASGSGEYAVDSDANDLFLKISLQVAAGGVSTSLDFFSAVYFPGSVA